MPRWKDASQARAIEGASPQTSRTPRTKIDPEEAAADAALRATLPDSPCFRCGDRGWCKHRPQP